MNKNREHSLPHEGSRTRGSRRITGTQDHEDHGDGSTDHLSRQTMRIKTVMNHNQENDQKNRPHDHIDGILKDKNNTIMERQYAER